VSTIFKKLNLKGQSSIVVVNAPATFEEELSNLIGVTVVRDLYQTDAIDFALAFVTHQDEIDALTQAITTKIKGDATVWFAYPKQSSKRYTCEFNRDTGWTELGKAGFEGVRQVAIDEDWSALRFRRAEFIISMKRDSKMALSALGKARTSKD
jgi:hypothetical protein